jgi:hypothetical protein
MDAHEEAPSPHLRYSVMSSVQESVPAFVPGVFERACDYRENIEPPVVEHVRDVLNDHRYRREALYELEIVPVQARAFIVEECLWMLIYLAQLGAPDACERLTGRPSHQQVNFSECVGALWTHIPNKVVWIRLRDVSRECVPLYRLGMEIQRVRSSGRRIELHCTNHLTPSEVCAERQAPTASEQVNHARRLAVFQTVEFPSNDPL